MLSNYYPKDIQSCFCNKRTFSQRKFSLASFFYSRNIYQIDKGDYNKFLRENVANTYKRSTANQVKKINRQSKKTTEKFNIKDRVEKIQWTEAYIMAKNAKEGFPNFSD